MKEIIVLVGNIGSGKSTLAKQYQMDGYVVIARDTLRYAIGGGTYVFNFDYEPIIKKIEYKMLRCFMDLGVDIIVDEVGISKLMREKYIFMADIYGYKITCIELKKLSKKKSIDRRMTNPHGTPDRKVWEGVWDRFNDSYEQPSIDEGFDEVIRL